MDKEIIFLTEEAVDGGYTARALGYSIYTEADTFEELKNKIKESVECHFGPQEMPHIVRLHMVKDELMVV